ncbi:MAG TPA: hypothetical protein VLC09_06635 [Polyangiaceae bacterium]|nr:hypothetical protein [Polyangiaceae bacterium]
MRFSAWLGRAAVCAGLVTMMSGCGGATPDPAALPRVVIPLEEEPAPAASSTVPPAKTPPPPPANVDPPDPPAQQTRERIDYHFRYTSGEPSLVAAVRLPASTTELTPRKLGRFAVELYLGAELLERARFDFPLLGGNDDDAAFEKGLTTDAHVMVPFVESATRARLLDRKTRRSIELPWPPAP